MQKFYFKIVLETYNLNDLKCIHEIIKKQNFLKAEDDYNNNTKIKSISMPTKKKIFCLLRSPHTDKDSREHFQRTTYKKIIYIKTEDTDKMLNKLLMIRIWFLFNFSLDVCMNSQN